MRKEDFNRPEPVDYDPNNPLHVALWLQAGQPDLNELDAHGLPWRPPSLGPISDSEKEKLITEITSKHNPLAKLKNSLLRSNKNATDKILSLKTEAMALLISKGKSESEASALGSEFIMTFAGSIYGYEQAGGNSVAGQALLEAIQASPPTWWDDQMLQLFSNILLGA